MFKLNSSAFRNGERIPTKHATRVVSGGENVSLPLSWENPPADTRSYAIVMTDKHRIANSWVHWLVIDIPNSTTSLPQGASGKDMPLGAMELNNTFGYQGYGGPQAPPGTGQHDYETAVYALDIENIALGKNTSFDEFNQAVQGHVLASAKLMGTFSR